MILEFVRSLDVCCSGHVARASIFPVLLHGSRDLSLNGVSGLEEKSVIFTVLLAFPADCSFATKERR